MDLKCRCICGCKLLVALDSAGKRIKCPKCERRLRIPVDVVERRRAQLESRHAGPPEAIPLSKIETPLSTLVDLPEPEAPPIHTGSSQPKPPPSQPREPRKPSTPPPAKTPPLKSPSVETPPARTPPSEPPPLAPPMPVDRARPASPPEELPDKVDRPQKPPPLPKRSKEQATTRQEPVESEEFPQPAAATVEASPVVAEPAAVAESSSTNMFDEAAEIPQLESDDAALPVRGYQADRDKVATVRWLAAAILLTGLVGTVPAIIDVVEHALSETSTGLSRWACGLFLVGLLQCAYAVYLVQLPDWSSVWVVTVFTLAIAATYAAMFGLTLLSSDQGDFVQMLDLADRLRGGKATAWCLIMLSLMSLTSYFSGRVGARWRNAFVA